MRLNFTKKLFAGLFLTMFVPLTATAQERIWINATNFPDENFRDYLKNLTYGQDGILTADEIEKIKSIYVYRQNISSLKGIEFFTNLTTLSCYANKLTELDVSKNTKLIRLTCYGNQLTELDVSKNTELTYLSCDGNLLTELDVSKNTELTHLGCPSNKLTELDVSKNTKLTYLSCGNNLLTELDVSKNTELTELYCNNSQLTELDVSKNTKLTELSCDINKLTELDVSKNTELTRLSCPSNKLTELDVSKNTKLTSLYCNKNLLTELDVSKNTELTYLSCYSNKLTELDVSKKTELKELDCEYNQLTALDLSNTPQLASIICRNNQLRYLTLDGCDFTTLYCYNNKINEEFVYYAFAGISYSNNAGTTRTIYFKYGADDENSYPNKTFNYGTINTTMFQWYDNGWKDYSGSGRQIPTVSVSVGEDGIATYCPIAPVNFGNAKNIAAYRASIEDNTVKLTRVTGYVRKGEGVLLRSLNGGAATENLPLVTSNLGGYKNSFVGVVDNGIRKEVIVPEKEEDSNVTNFVLSKKNGVIGFYKAKPEGTKVALGKAYLPVENYDETAAEAGLRIVFDDATAIDNVEVQQETEDDAIYTLSGVRVTNPTQKGIYIRNGKKVIIK